MAILDKSTNLTGKLLLAMPAMSDPRFYKAVIYICAHDEKGAMGLIVNHQLPNLEFPDLLQQLNITSDITLDTQKIRIPVLSGGPVEMARGFLLHSPEFQQKDTIQIDQNLCVTGTIEALRDVAAGKGPDKMLFILGYAGWTAGQLEQELQDNAWLLVNPDPAVIFEPLHDKKWDMALALLGVDPAMLSNDAGHA